MMLGGRAAATMYTGEEASEVAHNARDELRSLLRRVWVLAAIVLLCTGLALQRAAPAAVGALVLVTGVAATIWSRLSLERIGYERRWSAQRAFVGEELEATFTLRNRKALPLPWFEVRVTVPDQMPPTGEKHPSPAFPGAYYYRHTTSLTWYERVSWKQRFTCAARGYYQVGPSRLRSGDIFGFFPRQQAQAGEDTVTVMPRLLDLRDVELPRRRPFGEGRGGNPLFEDQSRMAGLRDYRPGDPLKRIDWKATARRGSLQSRLYDPSSTVTLVVALNADTFAHTWEGYDPLLLERAVSVAASLASLAMDQRFAVGLLANSTYPNADRPLWVAPGRDPAQLTRVLDALAMVAPFTISTIEDLVDRERRRFPLGTSVAFVTAFVTDSLARRLRRLRDEGAAIAVYWVGEGPLAADLPGVPVYDVSPALRAFERADPLAYGGETAAGYRASRRAI
jgi:uncharacterized protein (DUF58 family)